MTALKISCSHDSVVTITPLVEGGSTAEELLAWDCEDAKGEVLDWHCVARYGDTMGRIYHLYVDSKIDEYGDVKYILTLNSQITTQWRGRFQHLNQYWFGIKKGINAACQ